MNFNTLAASVGEPLPEGCPQTQVLTAIFAPEDEARTAFSAWRSGLDLNGHFDAEIFRLLPSCTCGFASLASTMILRHGSRASIGTPGSVTPSCSTTRATPWPRWVKRTYQL